MFHKKYFPVSPQRWPADSSSCCWTTTSSPSSSWPACFWRLWPASGWTSRKTYEKKTMIYLKSWSPSSSWFWPIVAWLRLNRRTNKQKFFRQFLPVIFGKPYLIIPQGENSSRRHQRWRGEGRDGHWGQRADSWRRRENQNRLSARHGLGCTLILMNNPCLQNLRGKRKFCCEIFQRRNIIGLGSTLMPECSQNLTGKKFLLSWRAASACLKSQVEIWERSFFHVEQKKVNF